MDQKYATENLSLSHIISGFGFCEGLSCYFGYYFLIILLLLLFFIKLLLFCYFFVIIVLLFCDYP